MKKTAKLPNGKTLQFPEGTPQKTIDEAVRRFVNGNAVSAVFFQGDKGEKGDKGDKGDPGQDGRDGLDGVVGAKGDQGDTGAGHGRGAGVPA